MTDPSLPGVSTREAAILLGTSESDVRRRIRRGELTAESIPRPGGTLLRVLLEPRQDAPGASQTAEMTSSTGDAPTAATEPPALTMRALDIMDALLRANGETFERQAEQIAALRERAARAEAERDAAREAAATLRDELARLRAEAARSWWRKALGLPPA